MPRRPRFPASHGASHGAPYSCVALCAFALSAAALCRVYCRAGATCCGCTSISRSSTRSCCGRTSRCARRRPPHCSGRSPQRGGYRSSVIRRVPAPRPGRADRRASSPLLLGPTGLSCFCDFCGRPCPSRPLFPGFFAVLGVLSVSFGFFRFLLACSSLSFRRSGARSTRVRVRTRPHVSTSPSASSA